MRLGTSLSCPASLGAECLSEHNLPLYKFKEEMADLTFVPMYE